MGISLQGLTLAKSETIQVSKSIMMMMNYSPLNKIVIHESILTEINKLVGRSEGFP